MKNHSIGVRGRGAGRRVNRLARAAAAAVAAMAFVPVAARAANQFWDINNTSTGATDTTTADGTWDNATANWTSDSTGATTTALFTAGNLALFSAGSNATGTSNINVVGGQAINGITIEEGTINLSGAGFTLTGATVTFNGAVAGPHTINNAISGSSALVKNGVGTIVLSGDVSNGGTTTVSAGTLTLTGNNAQTGATTVNAGTLNLDYGANNTNKINATGVLTLGNGALLNVTGNAAADTVQSVASTTLSANGASTVTVTGAGAQTATLHLGAITRGTAAVVNFGTGTGGVITTTNAGSNGILGGYATFGPNDWAAVVSNGVDQTLGTPAAYDIDDYSAATKNVDATTNQSPAADSSFNSIRFNTNGVTVTLSGTGNTMTTGGILVTPNAGASTLAGGSFTSGAADVVVHQNNTGNDFTLGSAVTGTIGLTKAGAGTLLLAGDNANTGTYTVLQGTLKLGTAERINNTSTVNLIAATLDLNNFDETVGALQGSGSVALGSGNVTVNGNSSQTLSAVISGGGGLTKNGTSTQTLSAANTYTGATNVNGGVLAFSNGTGLGTAAGDTTVASGAALNITANMSLAEPINIAGSGISNAGALRRSAGTGTVTYTGDITLTADARINTDTGTLSVTSAGSVTNGANVLTIGGGGNTTLTGVLTGSGKLVKDGTGTLTLAGNNTGSFSGKIEIRGGVLSFSSDNSFTNHLGVNITSGPIADYIILDNGTLRSTNSSITSFTRANRGIQITSAGGTIDSSNSAAILTYDGVIGMTSGTTTATLTKTGAGEIRVSQAAKFTKLLVTGGLYRVPGGGSELAFGAAPAAFTADAITLNAGAIGTTENFSTPVNRGLTLGSSGGALVSDASWTFAGNITGPGALFHNDPFGATKGAVTVNLTLSGTNTYAGSTTINKGTLVASGGNAIPNTSQIILPTAQASTCVFSLGSSETVGSISGGGLSGMSGYINLNARTLTTGGDGTSTSYSGNIIGTGILTKNGTGTMTILGWDYGYTGATNINAGTIKFGDSNAGFNASSTVTIAAAGTLDCNNVNDTFGALAGAGSVINLANLTVNGNNATTVFSGPMSGGAPSNTFTKSGTGVLTLNGPDTFVGATSVTAGTLVFGQSYTAGASVTLASGTKLNVAPTGTGSTVLRTGNLTINTARLDVGDNKLIVATTPIGSLTGGTYDGLTGMIQSGRNGGGWGGNGIVTSQSNATGGNFTSIAIASATQVKAIDATATALWAGQTVTGSDTLIMYTYGGDANLDGKLNVDDYGKIDFNIALGTNGWANGDFNYDGKINVDDYGIIDFNIGIQGAPFSTAGGSGGGGLSGVSAVPEPSTASSLLIGGAALLRRRRRRNKH